MPIKEKDFVEIEYNGMTKEENIVFDTTDENLAKETGLFNQNMAYGPVTVCIGTNAILKGLEDFLIGKEPGEYKVELSSEQAFGKKDAKLLKMIPTSVFRKANIDPVPGLQVNIDGAIGTIKTVTGGRSIVDFNHPLSGKDVVYEVKVNKIITDKKEKIIAYISLQFNLKPDSFDVKIDEKDVAGIKFKEGIKLKNFNIGKMKQSLIGLIGVKDAVFVETSPEEIKKAAEEIKEKIKQEKSEEKPAEEVKEKQQEIPKPAEVKKEETKEEKPAEEQLQIPKSAEKPAEQQPKPETTTPK
ncbi:peptidylprolyl isomerase [Candidatus Woesearchaeota archaeon]|nr:peptidylprolyl isomerase [Candidatus Woesearchaeota archaeon]